MLANGGKMDVHFEWLDMQSFSTVSGVQITVWNSDKRSLARGH